MAEIMQAAPFVGRTPNLVLRRAALTICATVDDVERARDCFLQLGLVELDCEGCVHPLGDDGLGRLWDMSAVEAHDYEPLTRPRVRTRPGRGPNGHRTVAD
jgi:hypothetical protein